MRAAILGACLGSDSERVRSYIRASTRITHTDPRAERGALLVALAAHHGAVNGPDRLDGAACIHALREAILDCDSELECVLDSVEAHLARGAPAATLADSLGLQRGVTGYVYHTVPIALYCWLRHPGDFRRALEDVIQLGGDTDSTGAIVGGVSGATVGASGIPPDWLEGLLEWPCSVAWMRRLAKRLASDPMPGPQPLLWPGCVLRNALFLSIVLLHGFRRLIPPY
jgi:ADP-ribosylglycohydrolase